MSSPTTVSVFSLWATMCLIGLASVVVYIVGADPSSYVSPGAPQATCPAPVEVLLVRCPRRDEVTGPTTSCRQKVKIDMCAA